MATIDVNTNQNQPRPDQGPFKGEHRLFLKALLPEYLAFCEQLEGNGPRRVQGVMGDKREWVITNVYPKYKEKFNPEAAGGPNLESLREVRLDLVRLDDEKQLTYV